MNSSEVIQRFYSLQGKKELKESTITKNEKALKILQKKAERMEQAQNIIKIVALQTQSILEYKISDVVSSAEEAIFDDPYELGVRFIERRNKIECDLFFKRAGMERDPITGGGHGAVDIAAFALRIASWSMNKKTRPIFLLDEPFGHLKGTEANRRAIFLMKELSKELGIQIITVSDERAKREDIIEGADKVFLVSKDKQGIAQVEEL